ncbi:MAG: hypothetical protein HY020_13915 [Burkholderiales bacterium]|nr:hypothetical protein [Burkholderiales bacterium]
MDPVSMLLAAALKNPEMAASAVNAVNAPGAVDIVRMQGSLVDLSKGILKCYHKTAVFRQTDIVKTPWERQAQYGAEKSAVLRIQFLGGFTSQPYEMFVAVMAKGSSVRSAVIAENTVVRYAKNCSLEDWVSP